MDGENEISALLSEGTENLDTECLEELAEWIRDEHSVFGCDLYDGLAEDERYMAVCCELGRRGGEKALRYEDMEARLDEEDDKWDVRNLALIFDAQADAFAEAGLSGLEKEWRRKARRAYRKYQRLSE